MSDDIPATPGTREIAPDTGGGLKLPRVRNPLGRLWATRGGRFALAGGVAIVLVVIALARKQEGADTSAAPAAADAALTDDPFSSYGSGVIATPIPSNGFAFDGNTGTTGVTPTTNQNPNLAEDYGNLIEQYAGLNQTVVDTYTGLNAALMTVVDQLKGSGAGSPGGGDATPGTSQPSAPVIDTPPPPAPAPAPPVAQPAPPVAQPPATPAPKKPRPAPDPPRPGVKGQVKGGFNRNAIAGNALWAPVEGKPGTFKSVQLTETTDDQIRARLGYAKNAGALAPGWTRLASGDVIWNG